MAHLDFPEARRLEWWPRHVRQVFANLGRVLGPAQLDPSVLQLVGRDGLPEHQILFSHVSGKERGKRKGVYLLEIVGPLYAGKWSFPSRLLEELARAAAMEK